MQISAQIRYIKVIHCPGNHDNALSACLTVHSLMFSSDIERKDNIYLEDMHAYLDLMTHIKRIQVKKKRLKASAQSETRDNRYCFFFFLHFFFLSRVYHPFRVML